jgi:inner membrane protein
LPTVITHSVLAIAAGHALAPKHLPKRFWFLSILCSVVPDADVIGFSLGIPYSHFFGHRGFFHSPFFALLLSMFIINVFFRNTKTFSKLWWLYLPFFFLLSASHGILDAFTNGGLGIALLSPFDNTRYFFPWRPILVAPIGLGYFLSEWGFETLKSEMVWIWLPTLSLLAVSRLVRRAIVRRNQLVGGHAA